MFQIWEILTAKGGNTWARKWAMNFAWNAGLPRNIQGSFTCCKCTTWDRRLYFPSEGSRYEDFFALKNPTDSVGFEPTNVGPRGQHTTSRSPKPLSTIDSVSKSVTCFQYDAPFHSLLWLKCLFSRVIIFTFDVGILRFLPRNFGLC